MKKLLCLIAAAIALPMALQAETWKNVSLMDASCASKADTKANPDAHSKTCAIQCEKGGYGIVTSDGGFLKFDAAGNTKVQAGAQGDQEDRPPARRRPGRGEGRRDRRQVGFARLTRLAGRRSWRRRSKGLGYTGLSEEWPSGLSRPAKADSAAVGNAVRKDGVYAAEPPRDEDSKREGSATLESRRSGRVV